MVQLSFGLKADVGICLYVESLIDLLKNTERKSLNLFFLITLNRTLKACLTHIRSNETAEGSKVH